jgi:hypothetical protein
MYEFSICKFPSHIIQSLPVKVFGLTFIHRKVYNIIIAYLKNVE